MTPPVRVTPRLVEIQALRAMAAMWVVLYHLWPGRLPGGYVGVDVFFAISGYLITAHLLREVDQTGRVSLARFWARRARRLLPAAYLVLASSAVATAIWLPQIRWGQAYREIIASGLYVQNWVLAHDAVDYLASDNAPTPVQHFWTLSVEEQFYLVWPLLVLAAALAARNHRRRAIAGVVATLTVASLAYSIWLTHTDVSQAYFVTPGRAWELGAGALLALWHARAGRRRAAATSWVHVALSWIGFAAIAWCGFVYTADTPFPGVAALVPVAGAVAVIAAGSPTGRLSLRPLTGSRPAQTVGDLSYSLYLWHWPPLIILPEILGHDLGFGPRLAILVGTFVAAWLTKQLVEDPIRLGRPWGMARSLPTFGYAATAAVVLVAGCLVGSSVAAQASERADAVTKRLNAHHPACFGAAAMDTRHPCHNAALDGTLVPAPSAVAADFANYEGCFVQPHDDTLKHCSFGDASDNSLPHVLLIGDSHARAMLPAFVELAQQKQLTVTAFLKSSCPWSTRTLVHSDAERVTTCTTWRQKLAVYLKAHRSTTDLIVTTNLAELLSGTHRQRVDGLVDAWRPEADAGIPIVAIKDNPLHRSDPNECLVRQKTITASSCAITTKVGFRTYDALTPAAARTPHAHTLDLTSFYCRDGTCPAVIGGVNVYRDRTHLTATYTRTLAPYIYRSLLEMKLLTPRAS